MADAASVLREWMLQFLRNRDAFFRKIAEIKEQAIPVVRYKDGIEQRILILPDFSKAAAALSGAKEDEHLIISTLSNKKNKESLRAQWNALVPYKFLTLYFINPHSSSEKKWVLMPHVHQKVCDQTSLMHGFNSLSEMVEDITEEQMVNKA